MATLSNQTRSVIGTTVQHYKIGERLGAGGMGEVYLAEDVRLGRSVALKFLASGFEDDPERRARLMKEARAASSLKSSNIAAIYDIGEHDGSIFIVMEYVEGELLSQKLERGPFRVRDGVEIAMQIADALDEAHARGIVHRDIKSANIMITPRGQAKILDFGLARFVKPLPGLQQLGPDAPTTPAAEDTLPGVLLGTIMYMAPEQALAKPADRRSDIFSLGIVLYEMLTARLPFAGGSVTEVIDRLLHETPPPVGRFNYSAPPELDAIVRKTLEKDPQFRYQSARDLYIDLHGVRMALASGGDDRRPARRTTLVETSDQPAPASPVGGAPPAEVNAIAVVTFSNISREPADEWIGSGIAETVTADLKNVQGLSVIGRERIFDALRNLSSADASAPDERFAIDIGRGLGATWIVAGGYQRSGAQIRITARLVAVKTGALVKTVKIDGGISEIFDLQDKIVYELTQGLDVQLDRTEIAAIEQDETRSVEAYESFSRGMMMLRLASRDSLDRAIYLFEKATEHDPAYATAWAALGGAYELKAEFLSLPEFYGKAVGLLRRAIELDPRHVRAYTWLGAALSGMGRHDEAIEALGQAIRLDPTNASAHSNLGRIYWVGKGLFDEAITEFEQTVAINPEAGYAYLQMALLYTFQGRYDHAEAACHRAIELQEQYISGTTGLLIIGAHTRLGYVYYRRGLYDQALREYQHELLFLSSSDHALRDRTLIELNQKLGAAFLRNGDGEQAERHFKLAIKGFEERLAKGADDPFTKYYVACLYALRGDVDHSVRYLQQSLAALPALNQRRAASDPDFDSIRDDPRFQELLAHA